MEIDLGSSYKDTLQTFTEIFDSSSISKPQPVLVDQSPPRTTKDPLKQKHSHSVNVSFTPPDDKTDVKIKQNNFGTLNTDNENAVENEFSSTKTEVAFYTEKLMKEFWDRTEMKWIHPRTGKSLNIQECIDCGVISPEIVQVRQGCRGTVSLQKAINSGQINIQTGQTIEMIHGENIPFDVAFDTGLLTVDDNEPMERCDMYVELGPGLVELIAKGEVGSETRLLDKKSNQSLSIPKSIEAFLFDTEWGKVKDTETGEWLSWDEARSQKLVYNSAEQFKREQPDTVVDDESGSCLVATDENSEKPHMVLEHPKSKILDWKKGSMVVTKPKSLPTRSDSEVISVMLDEAIKQGLYSPVSNTFKNPVSGTILSFEDSLKKGFISKESLLRDPVSRDIMSLGEAIEKRVVDLESGKMLDTSGQPIALNYAYNIGLIMRSQSPLKLSISEILDEGLYDEDAGTFLDPDSNMEISFTESLTSGLLDPDLIRVRDSTTGEILKLENAIEQDLINVETGTFVDKSEGKIVQISDALERGLIIDTTNQPKMSLQSALKENMIDIESCLFLDPVDESRQTLKDAIESCLLDKDSVLVRDPQSLTVLTLESAISEGIVHPQTGKYNVNQQELSFGEAFEKGLVLCNSTHGEIPCSLIEAIRFNLFDPVTKKITDPRSGQSLTLEEAISSGLINPNNSMIKDTQTGRFLSLSNAAYLGIINFKTANILDIKEDKELELIEAKEKGILRRSASDDCMSLVSAIAKGTVDRDGKIHDKLSCKNLILSDAVMAKVIDSTPTLVKDTRKNTFLPLAEALNCGIIDESKGKVLDFISDKTLSFSEAVEAGNIIEIPSTGLTLAEAVNDGLLDDKTGLLLDLRTGKRVTLQESIEQRLIDSSKLQVVVPGHGLLSLKDAFEIGVIDSKTGNYKEGGNEISLAEAVDRDLVVKLGRRQQNKSVSDSDLKNIETLVLNKDILIKDPMSRSFISLDHAVKAGIIDLQTETFCDLQHNIVLPIEQAVQSGLAINARNPNIGVVSLVRNDMFDNNTCSFLDPRTGSKVSLEEGVKHGLIDPFQTRVKNLETGKYISLQQALKRGIISGKTGTVFDKNQMKSFPLEISVTEGIIVDFNKPSFAVDEGIHFGLMTHDGLMVEDLESGEFITFKDAVERGTVKIQNAVLDCPAEGVYMTLAEGIEDRTVDETSAMVNLPSGRRLSLSQAVAQHMIVEKEAVFPETYHETDESERESEDILIETDEAIKEPVAVNLKRESCRKRSMDLDLPVSDKKAKTEVNSPVLSPMSDVSRDGLVSNWVDTSGYGRSNSVSSPIRFDEALKFGFLDIESGEFRDNITNEIMPIEYAVETGKLSIKGVLFFDEKTNFSMPLKEAIKSKLIVSKHDEGSSIKTGLTFKEALNESLLVLQMRKINFNDDQSSVKSETYTDSMIKHKSLDWLSDSRALSSSLDSLIQKVQKDQSGFRIATLFEALQKNLIDEKAGTIHDSFTQKDLTLKEAISSGLINSGAKEILDPRTSNYITLENAIDLGIIDHQEGLFRHPSTKETITLRHACEKGFISKTKESVESKSSVEIYVEEILANDGANGKNKLQEAFASGVLNKSKTQVIDPDTVQPITLRRAGSLGMIDSKTGEFKNPQTGEHISLAEAVQKGFILSPKGLSLYSAVNQGLYSDESGMFTDPSSGEECSLTDMFAKDIITEGCLEVRDVLHSGELIPLRNAIKRGIIDPAGGKYVNLVDSNKINFAEAIALGLIISNIPREGLRESSSGTSVFVGQRDKAGWQAEVTANTLDIRHVLHVTEKDKQDKAYPVTKESVSMSSIETESSGYETNKSQPLQSHETPTFIIDFEKYKLKPNYLVDSSSLAESTDQSQQQKIIELEKDIVLEEDTSVKFPVLTEKSVESDRHNEQKQNAESNIQSHLKNGEMTLTGFKTDAELAPSLNVTDRKPNQVSDYQSANTKVGDSDEMSTDISKSMINNKNMILSMSKPDGTMTEISLIRAESKGSVSPRLPKSPIHLHDNYRVPGQVHSYQAEGQKQMLSPVKNKVFTFQTGPPLSLSEERKVFGLTFKHLSHLGMLMFHLLDQVNAVVMLF